MEDKPIMLIVDDTEINRVVLSQFFQDEYRILEAVDGKEALELLESCRVSIVLVEIVMPVMDGLAAAKAIRASGRADAATTTARIAAVKMCLRFMIMLLFSCFVGISA